jgi:hypothetical protein
VSHLGRTFWDEVLKLVKPEARLPEPVFLAWCATELKGSVHGIRLHMQRFVHGLCEIDMTTAEIGNWQDANQQLAIITCNSNEHKTAACNSSLWHDMLQLCPSLVLLVGE